MCTPEAVLVADGSGGLLVGRCGGRGVGFAERCGIRFPNPQLPLFAAETCAHASAVGRQE
jgi:hypothetical protein